MSRLRRALRWYAARLTVGRGPPVASVFPWNKPIFTRSTIAVVGAPGVLNLNGVGYDGCPLYQVAQFSPFGSILNNAFFIEHRLAVVGYQHGMVKVLDFVAPRRWSLQP